MVRIVLSAILALLDLDFVHQQPDLVLALQQFRLAVGQLRAQQGDLRLERLLLLPHELALLLDVLQRLELFGPRPVQGVRFADLLRDRVQLLLLLAAAALQVLDLRVVLDRGGEREEKYWLLVQI